MGIFHIHVVSRSGREEKGLCTPIKTGSSIKGELDESRGTWGARLQVQPD